MIENISNFTYTLFAAALVISVGLFYLASNRSKIFLALISAWILVHSAIALTGFYTVNLTLPPRFIFLIVPALLIPVLLVVTKKGKRIVDTLDLKFLTLLQTVRIPVEITLYYLFIAKLVPVQMTFEGYNYDILSGISALAVFYFIFILKKGDLKILLVWNFACLGLLFNILWIALFSAQTPFQQIAFEQPNIGVTYFPFVLLPGVIVPLVFFSHLASIRKIIVEIRADRYNKETLITR